MRDNRLVITTEPRTLNFDLPKDAGINLKHEIYSIMKYNELLAEYTIKNEVRQLFSKYKHGNDIHEHGEQQKNEPHKFVVNLSQRLNLRSSQKHVALQNLSIYYTGENIRQQCKNNKYKIITLTLSLNCLIA